MPAFPELTFENVSVLLVAPEMETPDFFHWYDGVGEPVAVTDRDVFVPAATVLLAGCVVIFGAVAAVTVVEAMFE